MVKIELPSDVRWIIRSLNMVGFDAYVVGGAVRDSLLGRDVKDYDIVTTAFPHEIQGIFPHTVPLGIKHGTITVVLSGKNFEVTTMKGNSGWMVLADDLALRDFTVNAMAYNNDAGLIDPFGGIDDLNAKVIRCVGNPEDTFIADPLRMLRAFRLMCELNFKIDPNIVLQVGINSKLINNISPERIRDELNKILLSNDPFMGMVYLYFSGILKDILPELERCFDVTQNTTYHFADVGMHILFTLMEAKESHDLSILLAMLFHDIGKAETKTTVDNVDHFYDHQFASANLTENILKKLKYDNSLISEVHSLVIHHMDSISPTKRVVKRFLNKLGVDLLRKLLIVKRCDISGQSKEFAPHRIDELNRISEIIDEILLENDVFSLKDLAVNGHDLMELGFKQGPEIGKTLNFLLEMVIDNPELNNRDALLIEATRNV
jgi:tRNA nucleotidyltransferase (CCA-adding enzyme)